MDFVVTLLIHESNFPLNLQKLAPGKHTEIIAAYLYYLLVHVIHFFLKHHIITYHLMMALYVQLTIQVCHLKLPGKLTINFM